MPCSDGNCEPNYSQENVTLRTQNEKLQNDKVILKNQNTYYSACLCALLSELEKEQCTDIIENAQDNGKVDINTFWLSHQVEDIDRLKKSLMNYSAHELSLIKNILNAI
jgi:hypothetical protein